MFKRLKEFRNQRAIKKLEKKGLSPEEISKEMELRALHNADPYYVSPWLHEFFIAIMPKFYGLGASVVILGALFKIMHWPMANLMLIVGLGTEAIIFGFSAFAPPFRDFNWGKMYPVLAEEEGEEDGVPGKTVSEKLDHMMSDAEIDAQLIGKLGKGLHNLSDTAEGMADLSNATAATDEYAQNVRNAAQSMLAVNEAGNSTVNAMNTLIETTSEAEEYQNQMQNITKNLGALNAVYEMELQDSNTHLKTINKFYGSLTETMENMSDAGNETQQFKEEISKLGSNLSSLNNSYGDLSATIQTIAETREDSEQFKKELSQLNSNLNSINSAYGGINTVMDNVSKTGEEAIQFKETLSELTSRLTDLNAIYGRMLSAMKG